MKRDMDLIRSLLIQIEEDRQAYSAEGFDEETLSKHLALLVDAGLIEGNVIRTDQSGVIGVQVEGLTWEGHDFLDAARSEEIWNQTKKVVAEKTGSISFELLKLALVEGAKAALRQAGLPI